MSFNGKSQKYLRNKDFTTIIIEPYATCIDDQIQYLPAGPGHVFAATFVDRGCALPTECTAHQKLFAVYYFGIDRSTD